MKILRGIEECRAAVRAAQGDGKTVGFVPTMGALHDGHLSLVRAARRRCSTVAVSIFVNPTQFGPSEDFAAYPRTLDADLAVCESLGVHFAFVPSVDEMYPDSGATTVRVSGVTDRLCGPLRPGHFDGVATVVMKLLHIVPADVAFFGEKDYQQLIVIRHMVRDLNVPTEIVGCETVREADGLAMSSRNAYLSPAQRAQATSLSRALFEARRRVADGDRDAASLIGRIRERVASAGPAAIDYVEVVHPDTLEPLSVADGPGRICLAVRIGSTRLIDNVAVGV